MKRAIKFRGKRYDNGDWVVGDLQMGDDDHIPMIGVVGPGRWVDYTQVHEETIGQFTGLHDKNGKEIYEGDLLRYLPVNKWDEENFVAHEVFFHDNDCCDKHIGWQMNRRHFQGHICGTSENSQMKPSTTAQMEVIGNIHDNPELLEGGERTNKL